LSFFWPGNDVNPCQSSAKIFSVAQFWPNTAAIIAQGKNRAENGKMG